MAKKKTEKKTFFCCNTHWMITAGLFIGIGIGLIAGNVAAFTLIGLGVGYIGANIFK